MDARLRTDRVRENAAQRKFFYQPSDNAFHVEINYRLQYAKGAIKEKFLAHRQAERWARLIASGDRATPFCSSTSSIVSHATAFDLGNASSLYSHN